MPKYQTQSAVQWSPRRPYTIIKEELDLCLRQMGFARVNLSPLTYSYVDAVEELSLWFEADESTWTPLWGSSFTMELERTPHHLDMTVQRETRARFSTLLSRDDLEELRAMNNLVIAALPGTANDAAIYLVDSANGHESVFSGARTHKAPYGLGWDIWMHYLDADHIVAWADFLRPRLPELVERVRRLIINRHRNILMRELT